MMNARRTFLGVVIILLIGGVLMFVPQGGSHLSAVRAAESETSPKIEAILSPVVGAPAFSVPSRKKELEYFPCAECHEEEPINRRERKLEEEHEDLVLDHGNGQFWCITCHGSQTKNTFLSLKGKPIDFDQAYILCGQCHFDRQKDWYFGAHGKRLDSWKNERTILSCPACHNPHSPSIKPFEPESPPEVRKGLTLKIWKQSKHKPKWAGDIKNGEAH